MRGAIRTTRSTSATHQIQRQPGSQGTQSKKIIIKYIIVIMFRENKGRAGKDCWLILFM